MKPVRTFCCCLVLMMAGRAFAGAGDKPAQPAEGASTQSAPQAAATSAASDQAEVNQKWMVEGQKRYLTNCGRCHQSPREFSPREMATAVRHMRVRAMLTDEDTNYLLYYLTHQ